EFEVTNASGLANNVRVRRFPQAFMFEGLEAWNLEAGPAPAHDHEFAGGRTTYPDQIAGAYHATRLPVLEHLAARRRQAGAIVFMEVYDDWVPLGVWRYRELARAGPRKKPQRCPRPGPAWTRARSISWSSRRGTRISARHVPSCRAPHPSAPSSNWTRISRSASGGSSSGPSTARRKGSSSTTKDRTRAA